jgi:hypothetical protein
VRHCGTAVATDDEDMQMPYHPTIYSATRTETRAIILPTTDGYDAPTPTTGGRTAGD